MKAKTVSQNSFWNQLESKRITNRQEVEQYLTQKLGKPKSELQQNLLFELTKKINFYYSSEPFQSHTAYSLLGIVQEIVEKRFKEGKRKGQTFYSIRITSNGQSDKLRALQEDLPKEKWTQITKLAILGKNLVFKYKKWLLNKDLVDFYPPEK